MVSVEEGIKLANEQLKKEKVSVRIKQRGHSLFLVGTLPPKPKSKKQKPHQQEISLSKLQAEPGNLPYAQEQARRVDRDLRNDKFDWTEYSAKVHAEVHKTIGGHLKDYETNYWRTHVRDEANELNWQRMYWPYFKKLDLEAYPTLDEFIKVVEYYKPDSHSRARACQKLAALAEWCELSPKDLRRLKSLRGRYNISRTKPRSVLTDQQIVEMRVRIPPGPMRWMFEALVVWGLRPHELYEIDMAQLTAKGGENEKGLIAVYSQKTKKRRTVSAIYPEWFRRWRLWEGMPPPTNRKRDKGATITYYFDKLDLGIQAYDLRHSWAVRALYYPGIDEAQAARQMGHSLTVHQRVYEYWLDEPRSREELEKNAVVIPDDPPDLEEYTKVKHSDRQVDKKNPNDYVKTHCGNCGSSQVIWNGWAVTAGKIYGRRQLCQVCKKVQTIKPNSLPHSSTL